jgi:hypothetical protein
MVYIKTKIKDAKSLCVSRIILSKNQFVAEIYGVLITNTNIENIL